MFVISVMAKDEQHAIYSQGLHISSLMKVEGVFIMQVHFWMLLPNCMHKHAFLTQ